MFVCCECCVLSGRGLCDELITCSEEFYRLWYVVVCDLETSRMRRSWPALDRSAIEKKHPGDWHGPISGYSYKIFGLTPERWVFCLQLTPWNKNVVENLSHSDKNLSFFYVTRRFNNMLTRAHYMSLFWARSIHSKPSKIFYKIHFNITLQRMFSVLPNKKCSVR
jgi:hypothetical protein